MFRTQMDHLVHQEQLRDAVADVERDWLAEESLRDSERRKTQVGLLIGALVGVPVLAYALSNSLQIAAWLRFAH